MSSPLACYGLSLSISHGNTFHLAGSCSASNSSRFASLTRAPASETIDTERNSQSKGRKIDMSEAISTGSPQLRSICDHRALLEDARWGTTRRDCSVPSPPPLARRIAAARRVHWAVSCRLTCRRGTDQSYPLFEPSNQLDQAVVSHLTPPTTPPTSGTLSVAAAVCPLVPSRSHARCSASGNDNAFSS
jgi:hypothetical protein